MTQGRMMCGCFDRVPVVLLLLLLLLLLLSVTHMDTHLKARAAV